MRDFSGPGAPPARYLQRPRGRRGERKKCLQDDARVHVGKSINFPRIFATILQPSFLASFLYRSLTKQNTAVPPKKYASRSVRISMIYLIYTSFGNRFFFFASCLSSILNQLKLIERLFICVRTRSNSFWINVAVLLVFVPKIRLIKWAVSKVR